ncbi:MAG: oxidoreductase [Gammaproteobacteria bacterium]|nr:MAG: oxidoreductase [Gammaproteobacteria bacterium]
MSSFRAYRVHNEDGQIQGRLEDIELDALGEGEVVIRAAFSDVNYKDALAATGTGRIMRRFPMVGGIDVSGRVHSSSDDRFKEGDAVLVAGCGLGEEHDGGYAEFVRVPADWVIALPDGMSLYQAMSFGTAGLTAGLAVTQMELNGQTPEMGTILVTGATGGVGSLAIDMLAGLGYSVAALTGKRESADYLTGLGASEIVYRDELEMGERPLERGLWAGAVDSVGGKVLAWITRTVNPMGNIASIGLAGGHELDTTVMPFILRGVNLLGINSVYCAMELKQRVWGRLAGDLKPRHLDSIVTRDVDLAELSTVFDGYIKGEVTGRTVVRVGGEDV